MKTKCCRWLRRLPRPAAAIAGLALIAWGGQAVAAPTITGADWNGTSLEVQGKDAGRRNTVSVWNAYDDSREIGNTTSKRNGEWKLKTNKRNPPNPVPCAVRASIDATGETTEPYPVSNAPSNCMPKPPVGQVCDISVTPTTLAFGDVQVGTTSAAQTTTVSNSGGADCEVTVTQTGSTDFSAAPLSLTVAPGGSQDVAVDYTPDAVGGDAGNLAVGSNDPDTPNVDVALSGNGVDQQVQECNISVAPIALNFGDVQINTTSTLSTTVSNSGLADCGVTITQTGSTDFVAAPLSFTVASAGSQVVTVDYTPPAVGGDAGNLAVGSNDPDTPNVDVSLAGNGIDNAVVCVPADLNISINSTSQNGCPDGTTPQQPVVNNLTSSHSVLAINDLGMHCGDLDTRISSILPPFQVLLAQVIQKGSEPTLNPAGANVYYSAASNQSDPILDLGVFEGVMGNGDTFKTNFWSSAIASGTYNAFYPFDIDALMTDDLGLPVPNLEILYIDGNGDVVPGGTGIIQAVQHAMPGIANPYGADNLGNAPQLVEEHYIDKPFFVGFPFGYVAADVNWYEGAGIPFAAFDDNGRENAYPLARVQVTTNGAPPNATNVVATVDTVLPISGEASCTNCHTETNDYESVEGIPARTQDPITALGDLPVAFTVDDPDSNLPPRVSLEYAADINVLRLHDLKHGARYVNTGCDGVPVGENCLADPTVADPCTINAANPNGSTSCLTNQALVQNKPVVCQVCHYTPALDLAHVGPQAGAPGTPANGRNQVAHESNSRVMHNFHGQFANLFTPIPPAAQNPNGSISNQDARVAAMEDNCYQCHPGTNVQCLRGAMFDGGMLCSDCHGELSQVGEDFSAGVSPSNAGAFTLDPNGNFYDPNDPQPRVPWANEPGCGSCHTGDANDNLAGAGNVRVNLADANGNVDNIRLRQAFRNGDGKATPIVPTNKLFAEPAVPASFNGFANPGAGNPQLYRVSTGHGGVMCEGCHGATHAEFDSDAPVLPNGRVRNDDVASTQLQGHAGTIIECSTCHGAGWEPGENQELGGPHGMHVVGDNTDFADGGHNDAAQGGNCTVCHGPGGRGSNVGTVLSVAKARRDFRGLEGGGIVEAGEVIGCTTCHN